MADKNLEGLGGTPPLGPPVDGGSSGNDSASFWAGIDPNKAIDSGLNFATNFFNGKRQAEAGTANPSPDIKPTSPAKNNIVIAVVAMVVIGFLVVIVKKKS